MERKLTLSLLCINILLIQENATPTGSFTLGGSVKLEPKNNEDIAIAVADLRSIKKKKRTKGRRKKKKEKGG
jgi:hypothetical protein